MSVAAEIYRKSSRYEAAVEHYQRLVSLDRRFSSSYLQRIADLQMQMGRIDEAMDTGKRLLELQSANPEAYRCFADLCLRCEKVEAGIAALRRAIRLAPRDNMIRGALADVLANQSKVDEAIELHWQSLDITTDVEEEKRRRFVSGPFVRTPDMRSKSCSIGCSNRAASSDPRLTALLVSQAYRTHMDFAEARRVLLPLLANTPRDVELLANMAALSIAMDDYESAVKHQKQLTMLADTAENRRVLFSLLLDAGRMDDVEAALLQLRDPEDFREAVSSIDRLIRRGDMPGAIRFCRTVLKQRDDLWEVKIRLAALLVQIGNFEEAVKLADQVRSLELDDHAKPLSKKTQSRRAQRAVATTAGRISPMTGSRIDISGFAST